MNDSTTERTTVVAVRGEDKLALLEQTLAESGFFSVLEQRLEASGKARTEFLVAIKPNFMLAYKLEDPTTQTDTEMVEYLIGRIAERGFQNIAVVESQNSYGNWFHKRDVRTVATWLGYREANYRVVDLTEEMVPHAFGGRLGDHFVGPTWRDADFRVSFAKNKTHAGCYFTLTVKNIFGCLPLQNKFKEYHKKREFDWPTIELLEHFPCHFGLIDAYWSADGLFGLKGDHTPEPTRTVIGGENIVAVEAVGARKMGLDPMKSRIFRRAVEAFGLPEVDWRGDLSLYEDWQNIPPLVDVIMDLSEELYHATNLMGFLTCDPDPYFEPKLKSRFAFHSRRITNKIVKLLSFN